MSETKEVTSGNHCESAILLADDAVRSIVLGLYGRKVARIATMADLALLASGVLARRTLKYIGQI